MSTSDASLARRQSETGLASPLPAELPLSAAQSGIWYAIKAGTPASAYNIAEYTRIYGSVDSAMFETALRHLVSEVESLRLRFFERDGIVLQIVEEQAEWRFPYLDLTQEADPLRAAETWMQADAGQPVNLDQGSLFCFALFQTQTKEFLWYFRAHHLIMDAYGGVMITRRLAEIYSALSEGRNSGIEQMGSLRALVDEDIAYRASASFSSDREFWLRMLKDCPEPPSLTSRSAPMSEQVLKRTVDVPPATVSLLRDFARRAGLTFPQLITLAAVILIHRLTGAEDLVLGQPMLARMSPIARVTPAMVTNVVPLRFSVLPDMTIDALAEQVRRNTRAALRRQRYGIADVRRDLRRVERPVVRQIVSVRPFENSAQFAGARTSNHTVRGPVEDIGIHFVYDESGHGAGRVDLDANPALYDAKDLQRVHSHYQTLLEGIVANSDQRLSDLPLLTEAERRQVLYGWNETQAKFPADQCMHELFEAQVERSPEAIAVVFEGASLSYAELNRRANRLAHYLRELGVVPDARVAVCSERSLDMVVGLLAILKAGGAYVPLDPADPAERLSYMLEDSAPVAVLTGVQGQNGLRATAVPVIDLETDAERWAGQPDNNADRTAVGLNPQHLAYVIYTSGSTGQPKGVEIPHSALCNHMTWMLTHFSFSPSTRVLQKTPISFDASVWEFYAPLLAGGQLVLARPGMHRDPAQLARIIAENRITVVQFVPTLLRALLEEPGFLACDSLVDVFCGGEVLLSDLVSRFLANSKANLHNLYGPTEATIDATWWTCRRRIDHLIPIGRPIANARVYVLDRHGEPVPIGAAGEIHIGGAGVARGYLNRTELTAERFVADPFAGVAGARMYRSGDLGRYLPDGNMEFLGRYDSQVKIRGFRIELGEIEARLSQHPAVREAVALAREDQPGEKRLVAYYVVEPSADETGAEALRQHLSTALPEYMVPAAYMRLESLPLTSNGKLDRRALPEPEADAYAARRYEAPEGETEAVLAGIWAEVLKLERVGRHDNFFELGGHSLLAVKLIERMRGVGLRVDVRTLFAMPTLAKVAASVGPKAAVVETPPNRIPNAGLQSSNSAKLVELRL